MKKEDFETAKDLDSEIRSLHQRIEGIERLKKEISSDQKIWCLRIELQGQFHDSRTELNEGEIKGNIDCTLIYLEQLLISLQYILAQKRIKFQNFVE